MLRATASLAPPAYFHCSFTTGRFSASNTPDSCQIGGHVQGPTRCVTGKGPNGSSPPGDKYQYATAAHLHGFVSGKYFSIAPSKLVLNGISSGMCQRFALT